MYFAVKGLGTSCLVLKGMIYSVCVCLGSVRLFVLVDDKGSGVFEETQSGEL